jgi:hypothetical protein
MSSNKPNMIDIDSDGNALSQSSELPELPAAESLTNTKKCKARPIICTIYGKKVEIHAGTSRQGILISRELSTARSVSSSSLPTIEFGNTYSHSSYNRALGVFEELAEEQAVIWHIFDQGRQYYKG